MGFGSIINCLSATMQSSNLCLKYLPSPVRLNLSFIHFPSSTWFGLKVAAVSSSWFSVLHPCDSMIRTFIPAKASILLSHLPAMAAADAF